MKNTLELPEELLQRIKPEFFGEQFREGGWYPIVSLAFEGVYRQKCGRRSSINWRIASRVSRLVSCAARGLAAGTSPVLAPSYSRCRLTAV